jgi:hypothetical protein
LLIPNNIIQDDATTGKVQKQLVGNSKWSVRCARCREHCSVQEAPPQGIESKSDNPAAANRLDIIDDSQGLDPADMSFLLSR